MVKGKKSIVILTVLSAVLAVVVCVLLVRIATISHDSRMIDGRLINQNGITITQHFAAPDGMHYVNVYTD